MPGGGLFDRRCLTAPERRDDRGTNIVSAGRSQNGFLKSLSEDDFEAIGPHLTNVEFPQGLPLIKLGQAVGQAWFPHTAVISLVVELEAGERVEVAMVGRDSILGAFAALGEPVALIDAIVLLPGLASVIEVGKLRAAAAQSAALRETLVRHGQALFVQAQQSAGCNASHSVEARLARWLLRVRDLCGRDQFDLTQELMAQMIGARRNSVSMIAHSLQQANYISYSRGHVEILDLAGLSRISCGCYAAVKEQNGRLRFPA
jgi:CRP-like cAMP-binding protein